MQHSQRAEFNPALEYSIKRANELDQPLVVYFGLTDDFPEAKVRHFRFMLEELEETQEKLKERGIRFVVKKRHPPDGALELSEGSSLTVTDRAYLPFLREWRTDLAEKIEGPLIQVEGDAVVPVEEASEKEEYAARTLRPKINEQLDKYMKDMKERELKNGSMESDFEGIDLVNTDIEDVLSDLKLDESIDGKVELRGGTGQAKKEL